ncbi:SMI1/KNR4 family protein [Saccharibacillus sp. CPCC 101409]|uniref:SMI1/KNR4 family protein n=1 Tax=Saccharibacillus sp. CPCC 101409 TaxID=3058041 RepID=UPI002672DF20|nr:SMI1/KNR4 family protein [Saccharibacillus sp. CPCC 101409]MDO3410284.1 SMI1/KNR4 family protein [Saccharibacillus sp. CPCC 101409]
MTSGSITREQFADWMKSWKRLIHKISGAGAGTSAGILAHHSYEPERNLRQTEERLGASLPEDFRDLVRCGAFAATINWRIPTELLSPFGQSEGDLGWDIDTLNFPDLFGEDGEEHPQLRYLAFHEGGSGDRLMLDLEGPTDSAVVFWSHEENAFRPLAPSLPQFLERITRLGLVGTHAGAYEPFIGEDGLDPDGPNARSWLGWLKDFTEFDWEKAKQELPLAIRLFEMRATNDARQQKIGSLLTELYPVADIIPEWLRRNEAETIPSYRRERLKLIGDALRGEAADWVRSLWDGRTPSASGAESPGGSLPGLDDGVLHYLAAVCLPEEEGLPLVLRELERQRREDTGPQAEVKSGTKSGSGPEAQLPADSAAGSAPETEARSEADNRAKPDSGRLAPPTHSLSPFHSRRVIPWMEPRVAFPYGGWDTLLAASRPQAEDLLRWLRGRDALRMTAVSAIGLLPPAERAALFAGSVGERQRLDALRLLRGLHGHAVLRKEKAAIAEAVAALEEAGARPPRPQ